MPSDPNLVSLDYLGNPAPQSFQGQPALPVGGPVADAAPVADPTAAGGVGGGAANAAGLGGPGQGSPAGGGGPDALASFAKALDLAGEVSNRIPSAPGDFNGFLTRSGLSPDEFNALPEEFPGASEMGLGKDFIPGGGQGIEGVPADGASVTGAESTLAGDALSGAGIAAALLSLVAQLTGNEDVGKAGQATGTAASLGALASTGAAAATGAAIPAGTGIAGAAALPALVVSLGHFLAGETDARQAFHDKHNIRTLMKDKVPAATNNLNAALQEAGALPADVGTEQLVAMMTRLNQAREQFNSVDHAFKGGVQFMNQNVPTGLSIDDVRPQLQALDGAMLKIQDELGRRGVTGTPGSRDARGWLQSLDPARYAEATTGYREKTYGPLYHPDPFEPQYNTAVGPRSDAEGRAEFDPAVASLIDLIGPGEMEAGLNRFLGRATPTAAPTAPPTASRPPLTPADQMRAAPSFAEFAQAALPGGGASAEEEFLRG